MSAKAIPVIRDMLIRRALKEKLNPPSVVAHAKQMKRIHIEHVRKGEITQLATILSTFIQLTSLAPQPTMPAPTRELTTVCVPLIGMPPTVAAMMKQKEAIETANIILI